MNFFWEGWGGGGKGRGGEQTGNKYRGTVIRHQKGSGRIKNLYQRLSPELTENRSIKKGIIYAYLLDSYQDCSFIDYVVRCNKKWFLYGKRKKSALCLNKSTQMFLQLEFSSEKELVVFLVV